MLFGYLRAEPLFRKFSLFSSLGHPLNLVSPIFVISNNVIAVHLCAFLISKSRTPISKIHPVFTSESPSDFGIASIYDITEWIALYLCAFRISKSWTAIWKNYPDFTPESPFEFGITNFGDIKQCNCATFMCFLRASQISKSRIANLKIYPVFTPGSPFLWHHQFLRHHRM